MKPDSRGGLNEPAIAGLGDGGEDGLLMGRLGVAVQPLTKRPSMTDISAAVSPLRRRMIDDMSLRNLSPATQRSYLHAIAKFSRYFGRSPDALGIEDVRAFQVHLVSTGISWPALNQTVCTLRFCHGVTLDRAELPERIVYARTPRKLPVILSADEVVRFPRSGPVAESAHRIDDGLRWRPARVRGGQPEGRRHR